MEFPVAPHHWWNCRPALLALVDDPATPTRSALGLTAVEKYWRTMPDGERHRFHRFTCEGDTSPATMAIINKMRMALAGTLDEG